MVNTASCLTWHLGGIYGLVLGAGTEASVADLGDRADAVGDLELDQDGRDVVADGPFDGTSRRAISWLPKPAATSSSTPARVR
jgi:hypothetical protein